MGKLNINDMEIIINDLKLKNANFDYVKKQLICNCEDLNSNNIKTYYLPFSKLEEMTYKEMIVKVLEYGTKVSINIENEI